MLVSNQIKYIFLKDFQYIYIYIYIERERERERAPGSLIRIKYIKINMMFFYILRLYEGLCLFEFHHRF